jgi:hypothetical protein
LRGQLRRAAQWLAAGGKRAQSGARSEQFVYDFGTCLHQMLAVVEDEQHFLIAQMPA